MLHIQAGATITSITLRTERFLTGYEQQHITTAVGGGAPSDMPLIGKVGSSFLPHSQHQVGVMRETGSCRVCETEGVDVATGNIFIEYLDGVRRLR